MKTKFALNKKDNQQLSAMMFLLPALILFVLFKYYPIIQGFFISFFEIDIVNLPGKFVGFANYSRAFSDKYFYSSLWNSVQFWLVGLVMTFWPPIVLALLINEVRKYRTFMRLVYFIPAIAPPIASLVLWKYIWQPDYGFANYLLSLFNIPPQLWLNDVNLVYWVMAFPGLIIAGGMNMLIYLASLQSIPNDLYESAVIDGAGFFKRIRYITLPMIMPMIKTLFILDFIGRFNEVTTPMIMTGGGPAGATETMILYAYKSAMNNLDYSYAITLANVVFIIVFAITALQMGMEKKQT